jgi:HK97 family phage prohead protease
MEQEKKPITGATPFIERRYIPIDNEFRFDTEKNELEGYASIFGETYKVWGFDETVEHGAAKKTIAENDIRALFNHDASLILGRNRSNPSTLELNEDKRGIHYRIKLGNQSYANDLRESVARGDVSQSSMGFQVIKDIWEDNFTKRTIREIKLFDVSPVTFPASEKTEVKLRSAFIDLGLDYNALNLIIVKSNREMPLEQNEIDLLNKTIEILNAYIPRDSVPPDQHTDKEEPDQSTLFDEMLERKIQVMKILGGI